MLASMKTLTVSSDPPVLLFHWVFYGIHALVAFRNNFQDHRRLLEQCLVLCSETRNASKEGFRKYFKYQSVFHRSQSIFVDKKAAEKL
jgi:hypothetical protein